MGQQFGQHVSSGCSQACSNSVVGDDDDWATQISHAQLLNAVVDPATGASLDPVQQHLAVEMMVARQQSRQDDDARVCGDGLPCATVFASLESFLKTSPKVEPNYQDDADLSADEADAPPPEPPRSHQAVAFSGISGEGASLVKPRLPNADWDEPYDAMHRPLPPLTTQWEEPYNYMWKFLPLDRDGDGALAMPGSSEHAHHMIVLDAQRRYEALCAERRPPSSTASTAATSESQSSARGFSRGTPRHAEALLFERQTRLDRPKSSLWWTMMDAESKASAGSEASSLDFAAPRPRTLLEPNPCSLLDKQGAEIIADGRVRVDEISAVLSGRPPGQGGAFSRSLDASQQSQSSLGSGSAPCLDVAPPRSRASTADAAQLPSVSEDGSPKSMPSASALVIDASPKSRTSTTSKEPRLGERRRRGSSIFEAAEQAKVQIAAASACRVSSVSKPKVEPWLEPLPSATEVLERGKGRSIKQDERRVRTVAVRWTESEVPGAVRIFHSLNGHTVEAKGSTASRVFTDMELPAHRDVRLHIFLGKLPVEGGVVSFGVARQKFYGESRLAPKGTPLGRADDSLGMVVDAKGACTLEAEDEVVDENMCVEVPEGSAVYIQWRWAVRSLWYEVEGKEVGEIPEVPEGKYLFAACLPAGSSLSLGGAT